MFSEYLKNPSDESNMNQDYSGGEVIFSATPPVGKKWAVKQLSFFVKDGSAVSFDSDVFAADIDLSAGNGIVIEVLKGDETTISLTGGTVIKTNRDLVAAGWKLQLETSGNDFFMVVFDFVDKIGERYLLMPGDKVQVKLHDAFQAVNKEFNMILSGKELAV